MSPPIFTIVIPAYNADQFLEEAICSVLEQTFSSWVLLIIDDGSVDNTLCIAKKYSQIDNRIQVIQQTNQGVSSSRNLGISLAKTEYVAFLDADDRWLPEKLAAHWEHFKEKPSLGISFAKTSYISLTGKPTGVIASARLTRLKAENFLYENPTITTSNLVIKQSLFQQVGRFDLEMSYSEDLDFLFRSICAGWQIEGVNQVLVEYRITGQGLSSSLNQIENGWRDLIDKARQVNPKLVDHHYSIAQAIHLRYLARQSIRLKLPSCIGVDFIRRAWKSDWRLVFKQPHRTLLVSLAVYARYLSTRL